MCSTSVYVFVTYLQLDVQLSNGAGERTQIGEDVFAEVGDKSSGMDIFLGGRKKGRNEGGQSLGCQWKSGRGQLRSDSTCNQPATARTHREKWQRLAGALQQPVHSVGVGRVQRLL